MGQNSFFVVFFSTLTFEVFQWREDKFTIWDDSFENELHNESGTAQVAIDIDKK